VLDLRLIREQPDFVKERLRTRGDNYDELIDRIIALDEKRRQIIRELDELRHKRNVVSKEIGKRMKEIKEKKETEEKRKESQEERSQQSPQT